MKKLSKEVLDIIKAANLHALSDKTKPPTTYVYCEVLFTITRINESRAEDVKLPIPSLRTVQRNVKELRAHDSERKLNRRLYTDPRFRHSFDGPEATAPGERMDLDHHLDVSMLTDESRLERTRRSVAAVAQVVQEVMLRIILDGDLIVELKSNCARQKCELWHKRLIMHYGIVFHAILYNPPELMDLRGREGTSLIVEVRADTSDAGAIFVRIPGQEVPLRVPALRSLRISM